MSHYQVTPAKGTIVTPSPAVRRLSTALGAAVLTGLLAACGATVSGSATGADVARSLESIVGDAAKAAPTGDRTTTAESSEPSTVASSTEQPPVTVAVDKTGWYAGFAITVEQATASESFNGAEVELALTFTNIGRETAQIPYAMSVEVDGSVGTTSGDLPQDDVPSGATAEGTLFVAVPAENDDEAVDLQRAIDSVVLVFGEKGDNRTLIPLAPDAPVDSVQPRSLTAGGTLSQSSVTVELLGGDLAPTYDSGEEGKMTTDLLIKVSSAAHCRASGYYSSVDYFTLTDAAGVTIAPDSQRTWYCCEAIYPGTVVQGDRSNLVFVVDEPGTGTWTLKYEDPAVTAEGFPAGSLSFTV
jgi:hypothetical protein